MQLDRNQKKAVNHVTGPAVVIAGPGSGKTTVITARILNLIQHITSRLHAFSPSLSIEKPLKKWKHASYVVSCHQNPLLPPKRTTNPSSEPSMHSARILSSKTTNALGSGNALRIWAGQIERIIAQEQKHIEQKASATKVAIYKIESQKTGMCYIGQTTNPDRRKKEHFSHSSNDRLRQAIRAEGETTFNFEVLEWVHGREANHSEAHWIAFYKKRTGYLIDPIRCVCGIVTNSSLRPSANTLIFPIQSILIETPISRTSENVSIP